MRTHTTGRLVCRAAVIAFLASAPRFISSESGERVLTTYQLFQLEETRERLTLMRPGFARDRCLRSEILKECWLVNRILTGIVGSLLGVQM